MQTEPRRILGLDVEYAHFRDGSVRAAEVCLVERGGNVVYQSFCNPGAVHTSGHVEPMSSSLEGVHGTGLDLQAH